MEHRIGKANQSFGRLRSRVWSSHDIRLETKLALYNAIVLSLLLYACEAWTLYARHAKQINSFHLRCLQSIMGIKWGATISRTMRYVPELDPQRCESSSPGDSCVGQATWCVWMKGDCQSKFFTENLPAALVIEADQK